MLFEEKELPLVPFEDMNDIHIEELRLVNELYESTLSEDKDTQKLLEAFIEDVKNHFAFEEENMRETNFFAYEMHAGEHKRVLTELMSLKEDYIKTKDKSLIRSYLESYFKPWIIQHVRTMDTVTAMHFSNFY